MISGLINHTVGDDAVSLSIDEWSGTETDFLKASVAIFELALEVLAMHVHDTCLRILPRYRL